MLKEAMDASAHLPQEISHWIEKNITRPIRGFEHKKRANGREYNHEEQIKATRYQIKLVASSYLQRGKTPQEILLRLEWFL